MLVTSYIYCTDWGLKPCPLCGSKELKVGELAHGGFHISCDCGLDYRKFKCQAAEVVEDWNTRSRISWLKS